MNELLSLSTDQLRRVADIKEKIESLQYELGRVLGGGAPGKRMIRMSAAGRARIAAAQRARWAKYNAGKGVKGRAAGSKPRRTLSPAARAKIAAAARARWARAKASGRRRL